MRFPPYPIRTTTAYYGLRALVSRRIPYKIIVLSYHPLPPLGLSILQFKLTGGPHTGRVYSLCTRVRLRRRLSLAAFKPKFQRHRTQSQAVYLGLRHAFGIRTMGSINQISASPSNTQSALEPPSIVSNEVNRLQMSPYWH